MKDLGLPVRLLIATTIVAVGCWTGQAASPRWSLNDDGGITWKVSDDLRLPHGDTLEMSGKGVSMDSRLTVSADRTLSLGWKVFWPAVRIQPNDTYGTLSEEFGPDQTPCVMIDGARAVERVESVSFDGILEIRSVAQRGIGIWRRCFPSADSPAAFESLVVTNAGTNAVRIGAGEDVLRIRLGCTGRYETSARMLPSAEITLAPGSSAEMSVVYGVRRVDRPPREYDVRAELAGRRGRMKEIADSCELSTGDAVLDTMFRFAKLHAAENVFATRGGLLHSPGGGQYYAATWCNDQVEYAGPWFAFTGDATVLEAAMNAYRHYMPFMAEDYERIPWSVIAEGFDNFGPHDRGDAAMWAYGASRFVLASGRRDWARELLPGLRWTLEYCRRKVNSAGVVASDMDELEGRLPAGDANLCTSSLYYDALRHAAIIVCEFGFQEEAEDYSRRSRDMERAIERHFGATVSGFETYRYYDGCEVLRSWMCIPLCMGIYGRADGTAAAIFSSRLRSDAGILSAEGHPSRVTWDRSALYAFRGLLAAGKTEVTMPQLREYTSSRLLGEHVPFPVEAWPEAGARHLSAESALYCRIFTEGLLGMDPVGFGEFDVKPHLPEGMKGLSLRNVRVADRTLGIVVSEDGRATVSKK